MFFRCHVVYVDESLVYGWDEETRSKNLSIVKDACEEAKFEYTILPLERVFEEEWKEEFEGIRNSVLIGNEENK